MRISWKSVLPALGLLCIAAPQARSQLEVPSLSQSVLGAGAVQVGNGRFIVRGTVAQGAIGRVNAGPVDAALGFWHPLSRTTGENRTEEPTTGTTGLELQASPNPFAGNAQVTLNVPRSRSVSLTLYNLIGQPMKTLLDNQSLEGNRTITLNADDLPSGRYTLILNAGDERRALSLLLVR